MSEVGRAGAGSVNASPERSAFAIGEDQRRQVIRRLRRAEGQIAGVIRMLEEGRDCRDVVTQLAAVSKAVDRAGLAVVSAGLRRCLSRPDGSVDAAELERLFLSLT
jgi:DNA-binding FrmR family transcriptional regulator